MIENWFQIYVQVFLKCFFYLAFRIYCFFIIRLTWLACLLTFRVICGISYTKDCILGAFLFSFYASCLWKIIYP